MMRSFFKSELENLHVKTGSQQLFKLMEMSDHNGQSIGQQKVKMLLDGLEMAASEFNYIPEDDKKRIIQRAIIRDPNFVTNGGLTPRFVWQSLNVEASKYFKEEAHRPIEKELDPSLDPTPKAFNELSPDLQKKVNDLLSELMQPSKFIVPEVTQEEIKAIEVEDEIKAGIAADEYKLADFEREDRLYTHQKKIEYGRIYSDPTSHEGRLLPDSPTFEQWLKENP